MGLSHQSTSPSQILLRRLKQKSHNAGINDKRNEGNSSNSNRISNLSVILTDPQVLECFVCFEALRAPIFQCENGHSSCCLKLNNLCALCSKPTGRIRNLSIEKLLESLQIQCPNAEYGCKEYLSYIKNCGSSECDHQNACPYVPFSCLFSGCDYVASYTDLSLHVATNHKDSTLIRFGYGNRVKVSFDSNDEIFAVLLEENWGHVVYFSLVGPNSWEQRSYNVNAKSFDSQSHLSFSGFLRNVQRIADVAYAASTDCVLIPSSFFETCGRIEFDFQISKKKEGNSN